MQKSDLIETLTQYLRHNPKMLFYKECINYLNDLKTDNFIKLISYDNKFLEAVRIELCYKMDKNFYQIYLHDEMIDGYTNYIINFSNTTVKNNFLEQIVCLEDNMDILSLDRDIPIPDFPNQIYVVIGRNQISHAKYKINNIYESTAYLFGHDEQMLFLNHQRLDRIKNFINQGGESLKIYTLLNNFLKFVRTQKWFQREKIMIFSSAIFQAYGTTYTRDIDTLIIANNKYPSQAKQMIKEIKQFNNDFDLSVLANDKNWYTDSNIVYTYKAQWLTYVLPNMVGATDIFEISADPRYHFFFMGIKFVSTEMNIKRFMSRSSSGSIADLMMFKKLNNFNFREKLCFPNLTIRQGKIKVFDKQTIDQIYKKIKQDLQNYYQYDASLKEISDFISKCHTQSFQIYQGNNVRDIDTSIIKIFHLDVKNQIYYKYCANIQNLLDIGTGQLTDLKFWLSNNIKNVVGIEPSISSIEKASIKLSKEGIGDKINVKIINSVADTDWKNNPLFRPVFEYKYDVITFQYTIHYVLDKIDSVILNILSVIKPHGKIIIACMDGNLIKNELQHKKIIDVRNNQEPIFAIIPYYDNGKDDEILVYFKGAYGVNHGSVEKIVDVDNLIQVFAKYHFALLEKKSFLDYESKIKNKMKPYQKKVSSYYTSIILQHQINNDKFVHSP